MSRLCGLPRIMGGYRRLLLIFGLITYHLCMVPLMLSHYTSHTPWSAKLDPDVPSLFISFAGHGRLGNQV
jgi:hypothetical protein